MVMDLYQVFDQELEPLQIETIQKEAITIYEWLAIISKGMSGRTPPWSLC